MTAISNPGAPDGRNSWEDEPTTGADLLREAAQTLREKAEAAQIGPGSWYDAHDLAEALEFIALMDPTVALAVADWLDWVAPFAGPSSSAFVTGHAIDVARAVLRRES